MSHFHEALHPDDLPPWHGESDDTEESDTAITDWLGGRQGRLDEVEEETPCQTSTKPFRVST
jgi:hypothetical protein